MHNLRLMLPSFVLAPIPLMLTVVFPSVVSSCSSHVLYRVLTNKKMLLSRVLRESNVTDKAASSARMQVKHVKT